MGASAAVGAKPGHPMADLKAAGLGPRRPDHVQYTAPSETGDATVSGRRRTAQVRGSGPQRAVPVRVREEVQALSRRSAAAELTPLGDRPGRAAPVDLLDSAGGGPPARRLARRRPPDRGRGAGGAGVAGRRPRRPAHRDRLRAGRRRSGRRGGGADLRREGPSGRPSGDRACAGGPGASGVVGRAQRSRRAARRGVLAGGADRRRRAQRVAPATSSPAARTPWRCAARTIRSRGPASRRWRRSRAIRREGWPRPAPTGSGGSARPAPRTCGPSWVSAWTLPATWSWTADLHDRRRVHDRRLHRHAPPGAARRGDQPGAGRRGAGRGPLARRSPPRPQSPRSSAEPPRARGGTPRSGRLCGTATARAPGTLDSHYAPRARVLLAEPAAAPPTGDALTSGAGRWGLIAPAGVATPTGCVRLAAPASAEDYARDLYAALRQGDELGLAVIVAVLPDALGGPAGPGGPGPPDEGRTPGLIPATCRYARPGGIRVGSP